ncbi:MAG: hypothetical protein A2512_08300 [Deltaproteobacteria bacterium RIFOXYD12_FULL_56_24]|nr:MAG: hypothetical protein A2512_08300 [Deltaproteobacteria bacterium RIFOXYD12_FULL_56_24]
METKQCGACGDQNLTMDTRDRHMTYKGEVITVKALPGWYCPDCEESEFVSGDDARRFSDEVVAAMQAIDAKEAATIRSIRKRLGLNQAEAAALFGGGVNAFSEYERGIRQPSRSTVLILKLLDLHPELLSEIRAA